MPAKRGAGPSFTRVAKCFHARFEVLLAIPGRFSVLREELHTQAQATHACDDETT